MTKDSDPVNTLEISVRACNALLREGVETVGQVRSLTDKQLLSLINIGPGALAELRKASGPHVIATEPDGGPLFRCENCRFMREIGKSGVDDYRMECHRHAPTAVDAENFATWLQVIWRDWCGEYIAR